MATHLETTRRALGITSDMDATLGAGTCSPVDGFDDDGEYIGKVCSECGEPWPYFNVNYCHQCGARVIGGDE